MVSCVSLLDRFVKLLVEGDPKAPFSIATTSRCRGWRYSFLRTDPLYPSSVPYNSECGGGIKHHFFFTRPGIERRFPRPLANILTLMPMSGTIDLFLRINRVKSSFQQNMIRYQQIVETELVSNS